jgi:hypothetical protein
MAPKKQICKPAGLQTAMRKYNIITNGSQNNRVPAKIAACHLGLNMI